jgi:hypothetical protein
MRELSIPTLQRQHGDRRLKATQRDWALIAKLAIDHLVIAIDRLQQREETRDHEHDDPRAQNREQTAAARPPGRTPTIRARPNPSPERPRAR